MTEKELRELKRRFRPEKNNIARIVGCIVNTNREIAARISQPMGISESVAAEKLLSVMKKALGGTIGTSLHEISFSTKDVSTGEAHKLLMKLRETALQDEETCNSFYRAVIESVKLDSGYAILLANDIYDVFERHSDGEEGESRERFSYIVCAICPIKNAPEALTFRESDSLFHTISASALLSAPELGFTFPAFDDRKTNIYGALYYTRDLSKSYPEFCERIFDKAAHMPPKEQKAAFSEVLAGALGEECTLDVIRNVHTEFADMVTAHKESHNPEPLVITKETVCAVLEASGVDETKINTVREQMDAALGTNAELAPRNIVSTREFKLVTPDVTVKVNPEKRELVRTEVIDGVRYIMIRATEGVEVNGININFEGESHKEE